MAQLRFSHQESPNLETAEDYKKLKQKLTAALQCSTGFCGVCLSIDKRLYSLGNNVNIMFWENKMCVTFRTIMETLFGLKEPTELASSRICDTCSVSAVNAYLFIRNTKRTSEVMENYIQQLNCRIDEVQQNMTVSPIFNALLVLQDPKQDEKIKSESNQDDDDYSIPNQKKKASKKSKSESNQVDDDYSLPNQKKKASKKNKSESNQVYDDYSIPNQKKKASKKKKLESNQDDDDYSVPTQKKALKTWTGPKFQCDICNKICKTKSNIEKHIKRHNKLGSKARKQSHKLCPECDADKCQHYKYMLAFKAAKKKGAQYVRCLECDYQCFSKQLMINHINKRHFKMHTSICEFCAKPFYSKDAHKAHVQAFHAKFELCEFCDQQVDATKLTKHKKKCPLIVKPFQRDECPVSFCRDSKVEDHRKKKHLKSKSSEFPCSLCNRILSSASFLKRHIITIHQNENSRKPVEKFTCSKCNAEFRFARQKKEHMLLHHKPDEKHRCLPCNVFFNTAVQYRCHLRTVKHRQKNPTLRLKYQCKQCNYSAHGFDILEAHINADHLKIAPYVCDNCDLRFTGKIRLQRHKKIHEETRKYPCDICGKILGCISSLQVHMRIHTGDKPYKCDICHEGFMTSGCRTSHVIRLHGEKNCKCPACGASFHTVGHVRSHYKRVHLKVPEGQKFDSKLLSGVSDDVRRLFADKRRSIASLEEFNCTNRIQ